MTKIIERSKWENEIALLGRTDKVEGGAQGASNKQAQQLANRTLFIKGELEAYGNLIKSGEVPFGSHDEAAAAVSDGRIPDGAIFSIRSENDYFWVEEYKNESGNIIPTGKKISSSLSSAPFFEALDDDETTAGISATEQGQFFLVSRVSEDGIALSLYRNTGGDAELVNQFSDAKTVNRIKNIVDTLKKPQVSHGVAYSKTFKGGEMTWLSFGFDGGPTDLSKRHIRRAMGIEHGDDDVAWGKTFKNGERTFVEFDYQGAPTPHSAKLISEKLISDSLSDDFVDDLSTRMGGSGAGKGGRTAIALQTLPMSAAGREFPRVRRADIDPIMTFSNQPSPSIYWPCLYDNAQHGGAGWTLFYSTDHATTHAGSGIYAATSESPLESFNNAKFIYRDNSGGIQTETPSVMYDEKNNRLLMFYQQANVGVGTQSTLIAESTDPLTGWAKRSEMIEMASTTQPGDGHTGYFIPFRYNGGWYGYSLFGGTNTSRMAVWRSNDGLNWMCDPRLVNHRNNLLLNTGNYDQAANVSLTQGVIVLWNGSPWWIGQAGPTSQAGAVNYKRIYAAKMSGDFKRFVTPLVEITPAEKSDFESSNLIESLGSAFSYNGTSYIVYRYNGGQGGFALLEIY